MLPARGLIKAYVIQINGPGLFFPFKHNFQSDYIAQINSGFLKVFKRQPDRLPTRLNTGQEFRPQADSPGGIRQIEVWSFTPILTPYPNLKIFKVPCIQSPEVAFPGSI